MQKRYSISEEWLQEEYVVKKRSMPDIATDLRCTWVTIRYWLRKYGIEARDSRTGSQLKWMSLRSADKTTKYKISEEYLRNEYLTGRKTMNQIAAEFGCSWDVVRKRIHKYGIPLKIHRQTLSKTKRTTTHTKQFQKAILHLYGYKCAICGYDKFIHAAHINPWSTSEDNSAENGIALCPNHHYELDHDVITRDEVRKYQINKTKSDTLRNGR